MSNFDTERLNIQLVKELKAENERLKRKINYLWGAFWVMSLAFILVAIK